MASTPRPSCRLRIATLLALLPFALLAGPMSDGQKQDVLDAIGRRLERSAFAFDVDFRQWQDHIALHRNAIDEAHTTNEFGMAASAALGEFGVSHLALFSPELARLQRQGRRLGIGITVHPTEGGAFVSYVLEDSPAWEAGLRKGDRITSVAGQPLLDIMQLAGETGETRSISWIRDGKEEKGTLLYLPFANAERSSMTWVTDDVALIKIQSFQRRYYNAARVNAFFRKARQARGIIIDLRNNRGGLSFYSRHLASKIAPRSSAFALKAQRPPRPAEALALEDATANARVVRPLPFSRAYRGEIVVLVDSLSASAADIIPAFVQESGRGTVIGQQTEGSLLLARPFRLPHGFKLYAPIAELLTPRGKRLENNGLDPDIELSLEDTANDELILQLALEQMGKAERP